MNTIREWSVDDQTTATRGDLVVLRTELRSELHEALADTTTSITGAVGEMLDNIKAQITTSEDRIISELKTVRQEQIAATGSRQRIDERVDDHEQRITKLETKTI